MKGRMLLFAAPVVLLALILFEGCASEKYVPKANEELYGTWTNKRMIDIEKVVCSPDGRKDYALISDSTPRRESNLQIASKWIDSDGDVWYKTFATFIAGPYKGTRFQELDKISQSGKQWEYELRRVSEFDSSSYPTKIDPQDLHFYYGLYYRVEE